MFEFGRDVYILSQIGAGVFNLVGLERDSNRWTDPVRIKHECRYVSDRIIRRLIGVNDETGRARPYKYLGQFNEVFEQIKGVNMYETVIIEIRGGIGEATVVPENVQVLIRDFDCDGTDDVEINDDGERYTETCS